MVSSGPLTSPGICASLPSESPNSEGEEEGGLGGKVGVFQNSFPDLLCLIWTASGFWCQRVTAVWSTRAIAVELG